MTCYILILEDDPDLKLQLIDGFRLEGFELTVVGDVQRTLDLIEREGLPHLAVIDVPVQAEDRVQLAQDLSQRECPIIVTGEDSLRLALESLRWADDFVRKPYAIEELVARIRRVLSRIADFSYARSPRVEIDDRMAFDHANNQLIIEGKSVSLTPIEGRLLHMLLQHRGEIVAIQTLLTQIWPDGMIYEDTLRVHMHRLRRKLEFDPRNPTYILTERAVGYSLRA